MKLLANGWSHHLAQDMWDMMVINGLYAHFPVEHFSTNVKNLNGTYNFASKPSGFWQVLIPSHDDYRASISDLASAFREEIAYEYKNDINLNLLFHLLNNEVTKEETEYLIELKPNEKILSYRLNPTNYSSYQLFVDISRHRKEALSWMVLLDDSYITFLNRPLIGEVQIQSLAKLAEFQVTPKEYLSYRRSGLNTIELMLDMKMYHVDNELITSIMSGSTQREKPIIEMLQKYGIKPINA